MGSRSGLVRLMPADPNSLLHLEYSTVSLFATHGYRFTILTIYISRGAGDGGTACIPVQLRTSLWLCSKPSIARWLCIKVHAAFAAMTQLRHGIY
jgi:hypothetical protein